METTKKRTRKNRGYSAWKRKDGRWGWSVNIGILPSGNPERAQGICKTEREAEDAAQSVRAKHKAGAHVPKGKDKTLKQFLDEWMDLNVRPYKEPKTIAYYEGMIKNHIEPTLGRTPLRRLTAPMVQKMINDKAKPYLVTPKPTPENKNPEPIEKQLSYDTLRGIRATLGSALTRAFKDGLVAENIAKRIDLPKRPQRKAKYLTAEQASKLLAQTGDHPIDRLIVLTLHIGLRIGEATGLTWDDVLWDDEAITIRGQLQRIDGTLTLKRTKSESGYRLIGIPKTVLKALREQRAYQLMQTQNSLSNGPTNPLNLVFLNLDGRPIDPKFANDRLHYLMEQAEIPSLSFHKLRHTAATLALADGMPLHLVSDLLGHSQIALTANIYGHAVPDAVRPITDALERIMRPKE